MLFKKLVDSDGHSVYSLGYRKVTLENGTCYYFLDKDGILTEYWGVRKPVVSNKYVGAVMTRRDWFAVLILSGTINKIGDDPDGDDKLCIRCYEVADALIRASVSVPDPGLAKKGEQ